MATGEDAADILLVVPKRDELRAVAAVFELSVDEPDELLADYDTWRIQVGELSVVVLLVDSQGVARVALATRAGLDHFDPSLVICVGTAAGRIPQAAYLDVFLATGVLDATEWRPESGRLKPQWNMKPYPRREVLHDIDDFVKRSDWRPACLATFDAALAALDVTIEQGIPTNWPIVKDGWVVTTGFLLADLDFLEHIWSLHARLRVADMETAGFVDACSEDARSRPWLVIRSVSDHGSLESKQDDRRLAAAAAAATVCRTVIETGVRSSHPLRLDPRKSQVPRLSEPNFFNRLTMPSFLAQELPSRLGLTFDENALTAEFSVSDLEALCDVGQDLSTIVGAMDDIREEYFTTKYIAYNDEADVRGYIGPTWAQDVLEAYDFLGVDPSRSDILYVGVSTGRDLPLVCPDFKSLVGIDLSSAMLQRAITVEPRLKPVRCRAEALDAIPDQSVDLYLSLRTYQSSLFDIAAALRQAVRVLRPGGGIVLSIPSGFLDKNSAGEFRYVPGLLLPGTDVVDHGLARRIAERILSQLDKLMFERIGFHQRETDLYIYARKQSAP